MSSRNRVVHVRKSTLPTKDEYERENFWGWPNITIDKSPNWMLLVCYLLCPPQADPSSNIGTFLTFKVDLCRQLGQSYHIWTFMPPMKSSTIVLKITKLDVCGTAPSPSSPPSCLINQTNPTRSESISSSLNRNYVSIESVHYQTKQRDHFSGVLPGLAHWASKIFSNMKKE